MTPRRLLGLLLLASSLCACDESSCGGGGAAAAKGGGGSFNASNLSAPEKANLGSPDCKSGMCPIKAPAGAQLSRAAGDSPSSIASLEQGAARLARQFDGAGAAPDAVAVPAKSGRSGWICDGQSCRRAP